MWKEYNRKGKEASPMTAKECRYHCPCCGSCLLAVSETYLFPVDPDGDAWKDTGAPVQKVVCENCGKDIESHFEVEYDAGTFTIKERHDQAS